MKKFIINWMKFHQNNSFWMVPLVVLLLLYDINDRKIYQKKTETRGSTLIKNDSIAVEERRVLNIGQDSILNRNLKIINSFLNNK